MKDSGVIFNNVEIFLFNPRLQDYQVGTMFSFKNAQNLLLCCLLGLFIHPGKFLQIIDEHLSDFSDHLLHLKHKHKQCKWR